jgi:hypothetical protein
MRRIRSGCCARRERPRNRRATDHTQKFAPPHVFNLSRPNGSGLLFLWDHCNASRAHGRELYDHLPILRPNEMRCAFWL